jgi:lipoyl(octanoyl) transferase
VRASLVSLGRIPFEEACAVQADARERVIAGAAPVIFTLEHDPVYTIGRAGVLRDIPEGDPGRWPSVHAPEHPVIELDRGGDVTYHGPGQLVMYPVLPLKRIGISLVGYIRALERACIATLREYSVASYAREGLTGVWVDVQDDGPPAKIAAIGVGSRRWVTYHGIAVNVSTDLAAFECITPCGIAGCRVTTLAELISAQPTVAEFGLALARALAREVGLDLRGSEASGGEASGGDAPGSDTPDEEASVA